MLNGSTAYRRGMWASSIRYFNGTFYIVVSPWGASGARVYYAVDPAGPWNYHQLTAALRRFFIDEVERVYFGAHQRIDGEFNLLR